MPMTWTAHTIHFLTQPELRALFRVSVPMIHLS